MAKPKTNFYRGLLVEVIKDDERKGLALTVTAFDGENIICSNPSLPGEFYHYTENDLEILF